VQFDVMPAEKNPVLDESNVWAEPTTDQLAAEAIDGIANAHTAIAAAKSKALFVENFFMSNTPCESRQNAETIILVPSAPPRCRERHTFGPFTAFLSSPQGSAAQTADNLLQISSSTPSLRHSAGRRFQIDPQPDQPAQRFDVSSNRSLLK
jgi:hypothetical protein